MRTVIRGILQQKKIRGLFLQSWSVSWPMSLVMFFMFIIGLTDVYVAGKIAKEVQAAYGLATQVYFIFSIIVLALTVGSVSLVSRLYSAQKKEEFNSAVDSSLLASACCGAVFTLAGVIFSGPIIRILNVPEVLKGSAEALLRIYSAGLVFSYLLINSNGILRASGLIRNSLFTMAVVCALNAALNFTLAFGTPLGYRGIAIATVASTFAGCGLNLFFLRKRISAAFKFSWPALKSIVSIGWPAGLMQLFWQAGSMVLFLFLAALPANNVEIIAAFTNGLKIEAAIFLPAFAFNLSNAVVVGNLLGEKKYRDTFTIGIVTAVWGTVVILFMTALVMLNARFVASLLSPNEIVVRECVGYIYIAMLSEPVMAWGVILSGALNGAGDTKAVMKIMAVSIWLVRLPLSYLLAFVFNLGAPGIWWSMNVSLVVQAALVSRKYFKGKWLKKPLPGAPPGFMDDAQVPPRQYAPG